MRCGAQKVKGQKGREDITFAHCTALAFYPLFLWVVCVPLIELSQNKVLRSDRNENQTSLLTPQLGGQGSLESYGERRINCATIFTK